MGITQKELARRMGVTPQAVSKRVKAGRLTLLADGTLDPEMAEREWNATREPAPSQTATSKPPAATVPAAARSEPSGSQPTTTRSSTQPGATGTYAQAKTADALYKAKLRQIEFEHRSGTLVRSDDVEQHWYALAQAVRTRLMAIPQRLAAELAATDDIHRVRLRLDEEIRTALEELAQDAQRFAP